jgi:C4-type Zn-finger protein
LFFQVFYESEHLVLTPFAHFQIREETGTPAFRILPPPPPESLRPFKLKFQVASRKDLWRVILKAEGACIEIPELEFEIGPSQKRQIDSIYNIIGEVIFNLGIVMRHNKSYTTEDMGKIGETIHELNRLLDVESPFTVIVRDFSGLSSFKPNDRIETEYLDLQDAD